MSKVRLYGDVSGYVDLKAPDVANDVTITLPNESGPFATETYVNGAIAAIPEIEGIGSNIVQATKTNTFSTTSPTFQNVTGLSVSITPSSSTSKILLIAQLTMGQGDAVPVFRISGGNALSYVGDAANNLYRAIAGGSVDANLTQFLFSGVAVYLDNPGSASSVTYSIQIARSSGTAWINRSGWDTNNTTNARGASSLTAIEVAV